MPGLAAAADHEGGGCVDAVDQGRDAGRARGHAGGRVGGGGGQVQARGLPLGGPAQGVSRGGRHFRGSRRLFQGRRNSLLAHTFFLNNTYPHAPGEVNDRAVSFLKSFPKRISIN